MTKPGQCDTLTNIANQTAATNRNPRRDYHRIANVVIESVSPTTSTVQFSAIGTDGNRHTFAAEVWGDEKVMWAYCPSTLPSDAENPGPPAMPGPVPALHAAGVLFLETNYCQTNDIAIPPDEIINGIITPKWPRNFGDPPPVGKLRLEATRLLLEGRLLGRAGAQDVQLDLLARELVPDQHIHIGEGTVEVRLTAAGFQHLNVPDPAPASGVAVFAPTHLLLTGRRRNAPGREHEVDLMDLALAPREQVIELDGGPIDVVLTQEGFRAFAGAFQPGPASPRAPIRRPGRLRAAVRAATEMTKTITILARDRRSNPDGDSVLQQLKTKLDARRDKVNHLVAEAPTVEHLRDEIDQLSEQLGQPHRVQIVGHGTSGMLSLGYHWGHRYSDGPEGLYYVLDANHFVYGVLAGAVKRPTEVWILGCSVGDNGQRIQTGVARGRTLLFDLSQMWECVVRAPPGVISADDFDSEGIFAHPRRLNSVDGEIFDDAT
ncbi:MAG TPA: hypothetical protein VKB80_15015, partial [Kofleriaceae bacterium]|nr:hypothetical protein [Kofleriaceae bacterium]